MAKLPRKTQKIFCGNPTSENQTSVFGTMKTDNKQYSTDVGTLQSNEAYEQGWKSATIASYKPFMEDFNTLNYINTSQLAYLFQQGIPEWDSATTYYINSFCTYNGEMWKSLIDDNVNNTPLEGEAWKLFATDTDLSRIQEEITALQNDKVSKSGDAMTGTLVINTVASTSGDSTVPLSIYQQTAADFGNNTYCNLNFMNSNNEHIGVLGTGETTDGDRFFRMGIQKNNNWEWYSQVRYVWSDGTSFWRLWVDGWLEQGGILTGTGDYNRTVTFLRPFRDTNYFICKNMGSAGTGGVAARWMGFWDLTTTSAVTGYLDQWQRWYACGYLG